MSTSDPIEVLIVEDDPHVVNYYTEAFSMIKASIGVDIHQRPAVSFEEAEADLSSSSGLTFHLVILDLRLPMKRNQQPSEDIASGLRLLNLCLERDEHPIPVLLVVSAHTGQARQTQLQDQLRDNFAYGRLITKGEIDADLERAVLEVRSYLGTKVSFATDGLAQSLPEMSPREYDLLRRAARVVEAQAWELSPLTPAQLDVIRDSPLNDLTISKIVGTAFSGEVGDSGRMMLISFVPSEIFDLVYRHIKDWLRHRGYGANVRTIQSGSHWALLIESSEQIFSTLSYVGIQKQADEEQLPAPLEMERRAKIFIVIQSYMDAPLDVTDLIVALGKLEPKLSHLGSDYVRAKTAEAAAKNRAPRWVASHFSTRVGAFGRKAGSDTDSKVREREARCFDEAYRKWSNQTAGGNRKSE